MDNSRFSFQFKFYFIAIVPLFQHIIHIQLSKPLDSLLQLCIDYSAAVKCALCYQLYIFLNQLVKVETNSIIFKPDLYVKSLSMF